MPRFVWYLNRSILQTLNKPLCNVPGGNKKLNNNPVPVEPGLQIYFPSFAQISKLHVTQPFQNSSILLP